MADTSCTPHTSGPWGLCDSTDARSKGYIRPLNGMRDDGSRPAVARICTTGYRWDEWRANARLIEAAPELLAACKRVAALTANHPLLATEMDIPLVLAAIAKAEAVR